MAPPTTTAATGKYQPTATITKYQAIHIRRCFEICTGKNLSNVDFVYANINYRLKIHFSNNNESFFDSMDDLISKTEGFPNEI